MIAAQRNRKTRRATRTTPRRPARRRSSGNRVTVASSARKPAPPSAIHIANILVPIDFSVHSRNALKFAVPLAEQFGAAIHLVFVVEPTIYPADLGFGQVVLPGVEDELREKSAAELGALIEKEIGGRIPATATVRSGNPHHEILDEADARHADLIVVASHGHSGVEQILFGSTADRILHNARCPVLTVRPEVGGE